MVAQSQSGEPTEKTTAEQVRPYFSRPSRRHGTSQQEKSPKLLWKKESELTKNHIPTESDSSTITAHRFGTTTRLVSTFGRHTLQTTMKNQSNQEEDEAVLLLHPSIATRTQQTKEEVQEGPASWSESTVKPRTVASTNLVDGLGRAGQYTGCMDSRTKRPHGEGTMKYPNGDVYEGGWVDGDWSGYGTYTTTRTTTTSSTTTASTTTAATSSSSSTSTTTKSSSNSHHQVLTIVYQGGFFDNLKHGVGVEHYYPDGRVYDGTFQLGIMGKGKMSYPDGSLYWGYFATATAATTTTTTFQCSSSSSSSLSDIINNNRLLPVPHGRGKLTYADGSVYDGLFSHGSRHGHGRMTWQDGRWYLGEWVDDQRYGLGIEVLANGTLAHEGTFCSDKVVTCSSFPPKTRNAPPTTTTTSNNNSRDDGGGGSDVALLYRASFPDRRGARLVGPMPRRISMPQRNVLAAACYCRK
jgi:hypothetical protein